jgi:hypothetical protein
MPRICALALATVVAIGGTLLGSSIHACDDRSAAACQHGLTPSGPTSEAFDQRSSKLHDGARAPQPQHGDPSPNVTALSVMTQADRHNGIFAQQFQRFVSKQSMATATAEALRSPWPDPALFAITSTPAVVGGIIVASNEAVANNLKHATANEVAVNDHNDLGDENHRAMGERRSAVVQSRASDNGPASVSWVELAFLVWGGLLTIGSGLRLIFG